jgi:uncharacterized membrane protein (DUF4010 family)
MARESKTHPELTAACKLATLLANAVMAVRVTVITALLAPDVAWRLAPAMGAMVAVLVVAAILRVRASRGAAVDEKAFALRNPFALVPALTWGAILCAVLLLTQLAKIYVGSRGVLLAAGASGLADVDAIVLASSRQAENGELSADLAALAIAIAVAANSTVKSAIALIGGGARFGRAIAVALGLGVLLAAGVATMGLVVY